ncbi:hypothetical protein PoB_003429600 [Plakobranchus ocellatus]|uniref:Uncharacterized protein n=1 Tax=Plakobranchus ocellatus TaxID=259542 RepID=A0AAV4AHJ5_9GAST|nr:hypothetical protein PoB_003429600 [Plakobranchus ocellatus]
MSLRLSQINLPRRSLASSAKVMTLRFYYSCQRQERDQIYNTSDNKSNFRIPQLAESIILDQDTNEASNEPFHISALKRRQMVRAPKK